MQDSSGASGRAYDEAALIADLVEIAVWRGSYKPQSLRESALSCVSYNTLHATAWDERDAERLFYFTVLAKAGLRLGLDQTDVFAKLHGFRS